MGLEWDEWMLNDGNDNRWNDMKERQMIGMSWHWLSKNENDFCLEMKTTVKKWRQQSSKNEDDSLKMKMTV